MEIKTNAGQVSDLITESAKKIQSEMRRTLQEWGNATKNKAMRNHEYQRRSGNLDKSHTAKVDRDGMGLHIYLDPSIITTDKGANYGIVQHNGSKKMAGEPWLFNAVDEEKDKLPNLLGDALIRALK